MTKSELLTQAASTLSEDQLDGLIAYAQYLTDDPLYDSAPPHVLASIDRGIAQAEAGLTVSGQQVFERLSRKIAASQT